MLDYSRLQQKHHIEHYISISAILQNDMSKLLWLQLSVFGFELIQGLLGVASEIIHVIILVGFVIWSEFAIEVWGLVQERASTYHNFVQVFTVVGMLI